MGEMMTGVGYGIALFWVFMFVVFCAVAVAAVWVARHLREKKLLHMRTMNLWGTDVPDMDPQKDGLRQLLADTGYAYDWEQDIFYSVANPWQRKMGYCSQYDDWATPLGMVFDCEPIRFEYGGKRWLIEFWKGQYGITTGGEIGIYNTEDPDGHAGIFKGTLYHSASDEEALYVAFTLCKNGNPLFTRADRHWWLTGFVLGEYSDPSWLTMQASVTFPDQGMRDAFVAAFCQLGYGEGDFTISQENTFSFLFAAPRSKQPLARRSPVKFLTMLRLKAFVDEYRKQTDGLTNMYDILARLKIESPLLFQFATNLGRWKESYQTNGASGRRMG